MAVIELKLDPSKKELKVFGAMLLAFFALVGSLAWWKFESRQTAQIIWAVGSGVTLIYFALPPIRLLVYRGWMYAAYPIGWTVSHILLGVIFYLVITPIGLIMRLLGYDPMQRKLDPNAATYWEPRAQVADVKRYFRQF